MSSRSTLSNRSYTPRAIDAEIGKVQVKLQAITDVLKLYSDNANDTSTEGFCDLVSGGIDGARTLLCEISEAVQMLEQDRSPQEGTLNAVKR